MKNILYNYWSGKTCNIGMDFIRWLCFRLSDALGLNGLHKRERNKQWRVYSILLLLSFAFDAIKTKHKSYSDLSAIIDFRNNLERPSKNPRSMSTIAPPFGTNDHCL